MQLLINTDIEINIEIHIEINIEINIEVNKDIEMNRDMSMTILGYGVGAQIANHFTYPCGYVISYFFGGSQTSRAFVHVRLPDLCPYMKFSSFSYLDDVF